MIDKKPSVQLSQTQHWTFDHCRFEQPKGPVILLNGTVNANIEFRQTPLFENQIQYTEGADKKAINIIK